MRSCRRPILAAFVAVALIGGSCSNGEDDTAPSTTQAPTTTTVPEREHDGMLAIGVFLPRTGPGAPFGEPMIAAIEDAVDEINSLGGALGSDVGLTVVDEGSGTIGQLLDAGVDAIIGPASSAVALTSLGQAVDANTGVVVCSPMATALLLDDYPDNDFLFRTAPSDSLQMAAIARQAERTGAQRVAIGFLDDPYGRGLATEFEAAISGRVPDVVTSVGFDGDEEDLTDVVDELLADDPAVVVVLGDADDGSRLLSAIDQAGPNPPQVIVNDSIRQARQIIQGLSPAMRTELRGVAPRPTGADGQPAGFFVAHAVDCVNLIVLAVRTAQSDDPSRFRRFMSSVSAGGRLCADFEGCATLIDNDRGVDYTGLSGAVDLSSVTGDVTRATFDWFGFDSDGDEIPIESFEVSI